MNQKKYIYMKKKRMNMTKKKKKPNEVYTKTNVGN